MPPKRKFTIKKEIKKEIKEEIEEDTPACTDSSQSDNDAGPNAPSTSTQVSQLRRSERLQNKLDKKEAPDTLSPRPKRVKTGPSSSGGSAPVVQKSIPSQISASNVKQNDVDIITISDSDDDDVICLSSPVQNRVLSQRYRAPRKQGWALPLPLSPPRQQIQRSPNDEHFDSDDDDDTFVLETRDKQAKNEARKKPSSVPFFKVTPKSAVKRVYRQYIKKEDVPGSSKSKSSQTPCLVPQRLLIGRKERFSKDKSLFELLSNPGNPRYDYLIKKLKHLEMDMSWIMIRLKVLQAFDEDTVQEALRVFKNFQFGLGPNANIISRTLLKAIFSEEDPTSPFYFDADVFCREFPHPPRRDDYDDDEGGPSANQLVS